MERTKRWCGIILSWCMFCLPSLFPVSGQSAYQLHQLGTAEGLSEDRYNQYVYQDRSGMVWISSLSGLNRFDGHHVRQYRSDPDDSRSLYTDASAQSRIGEDGNCDLWFATALSLSRYNRKADDFDHFKFVDEKGDTIQNLYMWSFVDTIHQQVWCSAGRRLFVQDIVTNEQRLIDTLLVSFKDRMFVNSIGNNILIQPEIDDDYLLVTEYASGKKLGKPKRYTIPDGGDIYDAVPDASGIVWVASNKGLQGLRLRENGEARWLAPIVFTRGQLKNVVEIELTASGCLLLATKGGEYYMYDPLQPDSTLETIRLRGSGGKGLSIPPLRTTIGQDGDFWISTENEGLFFGNLGAPKWKSCHFHKKIKDEEVIDVTINEKGVPWVLTSKYVVALLPKDTLAYELPLSGGENDEVTNLFTDSAGNVWVSTFSSLLVKMADEDYFSEFQLPGNVTGSGFYEIRQLPIGDYVIGTNSAWPISLSADLRTAGYWTKKINRVRFIEPGPENVFLASTLTDSLHLLSYGPGDALTIDTSIVGLNLVNDAVYDEHRQGYWLATTKGLRFLSFIAPETGWKLVIPDELDQISSPVSSLWLAPDNVIYYTISRAIMWYNPDHKTNGLFSRSDGVENRNFSFRAVSGYASGKMIFAGDHGLTISGSNISTSELPVRAPIISEILVNNKLADIPLITKGMNRNSSHVRTLFLASWENNITLLVSALDFAEPTRSLLEYRLKGGETPQFRPVSSTGRIELNELAAGRYELELKGTNSDGKEFPEFTTLEINIRPPLYRTWWAYTGYVLVILASVFGAFWVRLKRTREKEKEQLKTAKYKTQAAEALARAAKTETSVLRLQMNPHFIFNSLNSVNSFIETGKTLEAQDYLYKFADLIRDILRRSEQPLTRLDQAIQLLTDYLEAEQMRMGDRLDFVIEEDEELDTFSTYLPTMIIQPFVENAIWHGIGGREAGGRVTLRFGTSPAGDQLLVEVEDNGVGREATAKSGKKHASKALSITRRRLDLLNNTTLAAPATAPENATAENAKPKARFEVQDLQHPDGTAAGTRILLYLPLNYEPVDESNNN